MLSLAATLAVQAGTAERAVPDAVRREWQVRAWAVSPDVDSPEFRAALASEEWRARHAALDALARTRPGIFEAEDLDFVSELLSDEQPNVRAAALEVCARFALRLPESAQQLAGDPWPEVRLQYVRASSRGWQFGSSEQLALARDGDERVAWQAACASILLGPTPIFFLSESDIGHFWLKGRFDGEFRDFARVADALARDGSALVRGIALDYCLTRPRQERYAFLNATLSAPASLPSELSAPHGAGVFQGDDSLNRSVATRPVGRSPLVDLWLVRFGDDGSYAEREGRARLLEAATLFSESSAAALLELGAALDARSSSTPEEAWHASLYLQGVHAAVAGNPGEGWTSRLAAKAFAADGHLLWSEDFSIEFWEGLVESARCFDAELLEPWLAPQVPRRARRAMIEALADAWQRRADPGAGRLLGLALEDEDRGLRHAAMLVLVDGPPGALERFPALDQAAFTAWQAEPLEGKLEDLRRFPRSGHFGTPWREEFLRLWGSGEGRVVSVPELLERLTGDDQVRTALAQWLDEQLRILEAGEVPDVQTTRGAWRETETHARWLAQAWTRASEHHAIDEARALFLRIDPLGKELIKIVAASLAKTPEGDLVLAQLFEGAGLTRRARIEIALLAKTLDPQAAGEFLIESYASCDEELRLRTVGRLGELGDDAACSFLGAVALDRSWSMGERHAALDALKEAGSSAVARAQLIRAFQHAEDLELRRMAAHALGSVGDADCLAPLLQALDSDPRAAFLHDELLPAIARIELRQEGGLSARLAVLWCEAPQQEAAWELTRRFRGQRLPNAEFVYSDTLSVARALAASGHLEEALPSNWQGWDARLLVQLAGVVGRDDPVSPEFLRTLNHAALVGLRGEAEVSDKDVLILRLRLRLLLLALSAEDWRAVEGWSEFILEDWRTGQTTPGTFRAVFGEPDLEQQYAPTAWLRATRAQARAWLALAAGEQQLARSMARRAQAFAQVSARAARQQAALEGRLED